MYDREMTRRFAERSRRDFESPTNATPAHAVSESLARVPWAAILTVAGSLILAGLAGLAFASK